MNPINNLRHAITGLFGNGQNHTVGTAAPVASHITGQPVTAPIAHPIFGGVGEFFHRPTHSPRQHIPPTHHRPVAHLPERITG